MKKALGLTIALLIGGAWTVQAARGLVITDNTGLPLASDGSCYCMNANANGTFSFSFQNPAGIGNDPKIKKITWEAFGGIEIEGANNGTNVTVKNKRGTTYQERFTKYAKSRLMVTVIYSDSIILEMVTGSCSGGALDTINLAEDLDPYLFEFTGEIDICKQFSLRNEPALEIVGPVCIAPDDSVAYSVAPWVTLADPINAGLDKYGWRYSPNLVNAVSGKPELYYSADGSSSTFIVGDSIAGRQISVSIGACNPSEIITLTLKNKIPEPIIKPDLCLPGGIDTVQFYIDNFIPGVDYKWSVDKNWKIIGDSIGTSVDIEIDQAHPANIRVEATYSDGTGCEPIFSNTMVTRTLSPNATIMANSTCPVAGQTTVTFTLDPAPSPAVFSWQVPAGWDYTAPTDVSRAVIRLIPAADAAITDSLSVSVQGCESVSVKTAVNVRPAAVTIDGENCVPRNDTVSFAALSANNAPQANQFKWTFPAGWAVVSGDSTANITVMTSNTPGNVTVMPLGATNTCNGAAVSKAVNFNPTKPMGIDKPICIDAGMKDTIVISVIDTIAQVYDWDIPDDLGTIIESTNTSRTIETFGSIGSFTISVKAQNACGESSSVTDVINIYKETFTVSEIPSGRGIAYQISEAMSDSWFLSHNAEWIYNGQIITNTTIDPILNVVDYSRTTPQIAGLMNRADSLFFVTVENLTTGCKTRKYANSGTFRSATAVEETTNLRSATVEREMKIFPNPTKGNIEINLPVNERANIFLYSLDGSLLKQWLRHPAISTINISDLPNGNYFVVAHQTGNRYSQKIILNK